MGYNGAMFLIEQISYIFRWMGISAPLKTIGLIKQDKIIPYGANIQCIEVLMTP